MDASLKEYLKQIDGVSHITLNPKGPGVARIHLIPPEKVKMGVSWIVVVNGQDILPINTAWAIILREFINNAYKFDGQVISDEDLDLINKNTIEAVSKLFPKTEKKYIKEDLSDILKVLTNIANGKEPPLEVGYITLKEYAKYMSAPHRMDLMISAMMKNNMWACNQKCLHCYASDQKEAVVEEISTEKWKEIITKCRKANISQVTFTGGEPTLRSDLVELVKYSSWFVTRLNTNGVLLSKELCNELYEASLDSVQITFYSNKKEIHNILTGSNHFDDTVVGIKNALSANLNVSINTPLCKLNENYLETVKYAASLGVKYFTCSGIIMTGSASEDASLNTHLSKDEMYKILKEVQQYCIENELQLSFTSPGWVEEKKLKALKLNPPTCGACLSNMAVAPNGDVIPCQSYLSDAILGNLLTEKFEKIWKSNKCKEIRMISAKSSNTCQLAIKEVK